jgi:hypothetical protein
MEPQAYILRVLPLIVKVVPLATTMLVALKVKLEIVKGAPETDIELKLYGGVEVGAGNGPPDQEPVDGAGQDAL